MATKTTDDGVIVQRTYGALEDNSEELMEALMLILDDMADGDGDYSKSFRTALAMYRNEAVRLGIMQRLSQRQYRDAEAATMRLGVKRQSVKS